MLSLNPVYGMDPFSHLFIVKLFGSLKKTKKRLGLIQVDVEIGFYLDFHFHLKVLKLKSLEYSLRLGFEYTLIPFNVMCASQVRKEREIPNARVFVSLRST